MKWWMIFENGWEYQIQAIMNRLFVWGYFERGVNTHRLSLYCAVFIHSCISALDKQRKNNRTLTLGLHYGQHTTVKAKIYHLSVCLSVCLFQLWVTVVWFSLDSGWRANMERTWRQTAGMEADGSGEENFICGVEFYIASQLLHWFHQHQPRLFEMEKNIFSFTWRHLKKKLFCDQKLNDHRYWSACTTTFFEPFKCFHFIFDLCSGCCYYHILTCLFYWHGPSPHVVSQTKDYVLNNYFIAQEDMIFTCAVFEIFTLFIALLFSVI